MVTKFISGILKKKEEVQGQQTADVPDELPPLAEDLSKKEEQKAVPDQLPPVSVALVKKDEAPSELPPVSKPEDIEEVNSQDKKEVPDELPQIAVLEQPKRQEQKPSENLAKDILSVKSSSGKMQLTEAAPQKAEEIKETDAIIQSAQIKSFFSNILSHVKDKEAKEKLLSGDLFSRMTSYWELRKNEIKSGTELSDEQKLEQNLIKELTELQSLESKWQVQKMALEEDLRFLHEREKDIQLKLVELSNVVNELKLYKNVAPEKYFCMYNGIIIKNLRELIDALEIMDEETFAHHVNSEKNDFSSWVENVIKDKHLSEKLRNAKTREEMINIVETQKIHIEDGSLNIQQLKPADYFRLSNGVVIRSIYELSDALKAMNEETFSHHVNSEKNDFSSWAAQSLKNVYLAEKLGKSKTRQEMAVVLELFYS